MNGVGCHAVAQPTPNSHRPGGSPARAGSRSRPRGGWSRPPATRWPRSAFIQKIEKEELRNSSVGNDDLGFEMPTIADSLWLARYRPLPVREVASAQAASAFLQQYDSFFHFLPLALAAPALKFSSSGAIESSTNPTTSFSNVNLPSSFGS